MFKKLKSYMMPIAMIAGAVFYSFFGNLSFLIPYLIFVMLLLTFISLPFNELRITKMHFTLVSIQLFGSLIVYFIFKPIHPILAQAAMICVLAPTATSSPVVTGMLKGNVASLTSYSLLSNLCLILVAPVLFPITGGTASQSFISSFASIGSHLVLLLVGPLAIAFALRKISSKGSSFLSRYSGFSFVLWTLALCIVTGKTIQFIVSKQSDNAFLFPSIAFVSFLLCIAQFWIGRKIGKKHNDTIAGGQGLGQKNTVLSIWMAQTYLNPLSSIGPGAYVLWQNSFNSYQLWRERKNHI